MPTLYISELKLETLIGTAPWERQLKQLLCLDIEFRYRLDQVADSLETVVDYTKVEKAIRGYVQHQQCKLLETLAEQLANLLFTEFPIQWLRLKLAKPGALAQAKEVGIIFERTKDE